MEFDRSRFADKGSWDLFLEEKTKEARKILPQALHAIVYRKLSSVYVAAVETDLIIPPGNRYERLRGKLAGHSSIRINDQWRIVFRWERNQTVDIRVCDYH